MNTCEHCCKPLNDHEAITCDACAIAQLERILSSKAWLKVRGPYIEKALREELATLRARRDIFGE
jgi:hypothetical protein